jgi:hypothetical protein
METGLVTTAPGATSPGTASAGGASTGGREPMGAGGVAVAEDDGAVVGPAFLTVTLRTGSVPTTALRAGGDGIVVGGRVFRGVDEGAGVGAGQQRQH